VCNAAGRGVEPFAVHLIEIKSLAAMFDNAGGMDLNVVSNAPGPE
jgi:hypothetical protein